MNIIEKLLEKRGIKKPEELTPEEKATFEEWRRVLSKESATIEDVREFCTLQLGLIESKWKNLDVDSSKKAQYIPYFSIYKMLLDFLESPKKARADLEKHLESMLKS